MSKKIKLPFKIAVFIILFLVLSKGLAFLLCDESSSYTRIFMHELDDIKRIDNLYCGASHVSHGISAVVAESLTEETHFSTGSAGQTIQATYALLKQTLKTHEVKRVFLEIDFAVAYQTPVKERAGFKADYIIAKHLKDPLIKYEFLFSLSSPKYWINSLLPIGKDKHMTFNPHDLAYRWKSLVTGDYFNYVYVDKDAEYEGKGCLLDIRPVKNGTFTNDKGEPPIDISAISDDWKHTIDNIIELCRAYNVELIFYSMPCSDFYLHEKGNYDDYYYFCKEFTAARGFDYYDFNLAKETYQKLEDSDFHDDNHLSKQGVHKWTKIFCDYFFTGAIPHDDMFHASYAEKIAAQEDRIYGLILQSSTDKKSLEIIPVVNHVEKSRITYDVYTEINDVEALLLSGETTDTVTLPEKQSGTVRVISYLDGVQQNDCKTHFTTF